MHELPLNRTPDDHRKYCLCRADNGLLYLLISDTDVNQATAVFQVAVGSHSEPQALPGLAHLLEHMLFMGSDRYPESGSFPAMVARWGGRFNASTATQATRYFFSVGAEGLDECLHQLTDMLAAPCFAPEQIDGERSVIDAEFQTRLADDALHEQAALAQAFNPAHPLARFTAGNAESLAGTTEQLASALREWHGRYYLAGRMALVIHAPQSPEELKALACRSAAQLTLGKTSLPLPPPMFADASLPAQLSWQSGTGQNDWTLWYPLKGCAPGCIAQRWLCEWLNSSAPAGALGYLRKRAGLAELHARIEPGAHGQSLLRIELQALSHCAEPGPVLARLDAWLVALAQMDPANWPQAERQVLAEEHFGHGPQGEPIDWCRLYADRLLTQAPHQVLDISGTTLPILTQHDWQWLLRQLRPDRRLLVRRVSALTNAQSTPWTGTAYSLQSLSTSPLPGMPDLDRLRWPRFKSLPEIPAGLGSSGKMPGLRLRCLAGSTHSELRTRFAWCWPPGIGSQTDLSWLQACWSVQGDVLERWGQAVGIRLSWRLASDRVELDVSGPVKWVPSFVRELLTAFQLPPDGKLLPLIAHRQRAWLREQEYALPAHRLLLAMEQGVTVESVDADAQRRWSRLCRAAQVYWLKRAGWPQAERAHLAKLLLNLCPALLRPFASFPFPVGAKGNMRVAAVACRHPDRALLLYLQAKDDSALEAACWRLLHHFLADQFFAELRTRQQLGYWVVARLHRHAGRAGLMLLVQSPSKSHKVIESAIADFLQRQCCILMTLSEEQLHTEVTHLARLLMKQRQDPLQQFEAAWEDGLWQREERLSEEAAALQKITLAQWQAFVSTLPHCTRWQLHSAN